MSVEVVGAADVDTDAVAVEALAQFVLVRMRVHPDAELCIRRVDETEMAELNHTWMGEDGPTDVLAFPIDQLRPATPGEQPEPGVLGDLAVCADVARRQAGRAGHPAAQEVELLVVHGLLHLLGFDHAEPDEHEEMFGLQARLLREWRDAGQDGVPVGGLEHEQR